MIGRAVEVGNTICPNVKNGSRVGVLESVYDPPPAALVREGFTPDDIANLWLPGRLRSGEDRLDGDLPFLQKDLRPGKEAVAAEPVTARRRDTEDLRSRAIVGHGLLLDRVYVACDNPTVYVEPQLALVHAANPAQTDVILPDFAVPRARRAHDLVRALNGLPELRDLAHRLARRLAHVKDFLFRDHGPTPYGPFRVKVFCSPVSESTTNGSAPNPSPGGPPGRFSRGGRSHRRLRPSQSP